MKLADCDSAVTLMYRPVHISPCNLLQLVQNKAYTVMSHAASEVKQFRSSSEKSLMQSAGQQHQPGQYDPPAQSRQGLAGHVGVHHRQAPLACCAFADANRFLTCMHLPPSAYLLTWLLQVKQPDERQWRFVWGSLRHICNIQLW